MTRWQYYMHQFVTRGMGNDETVDVHISQVNALGAEGWELVSAVVYKNLEISEDVVLMTFKKPAADAAAAAE